MMVVMVVMMMVMMTIARAKMFGDSKNVDRAAMLVHMKISKLTKRGDSLPGYP